MPIAPALQQFVDEQLAAAPALVERTLLGTRQLLRDAKDSAGHAQAPIVEALDARAGDYRRAFLQALKDGAQEALADQQDSAGAPKSVAGLELMDESRVDIDIELSRAMQLIDATAEWELRELQTFTSTLIGQRHVSAESNPLRPQVYASALWQAACAATPTTSHQLAILRVSSGVAAGLLKNAWAAATSRLEAQGIEPGIYRSVVLPSGSVPGRGPAAPDVMSAVTALSSLVASMPGGSATMQVSVGNAAQPMGTAQARGAAGAPSAEFEQALARFEEMLRHPRAAADAGDAPAQARRVSALRAALVGSARNPADRQAIEFLARTFEAIAVDPLLPPGFGPVIARLQGSALRVAQADPEMLASMRHAVWQYLDRVGAAALGAPADSGPPAATLLGMCQALSEQLANAPSPDAALYRRALKQLDTLLANQLQDALQAAQSTQQALHLAERRELLERQLSQRLVDQMVPVRTSAVVRRFVTGTWARVLAESILREGEQGDDTRANIKLVDELLWSVQLPDHPKSRQRLISVLPGMLKRLRAGMEAIRLPAAEQNGVLDELMAIHTEALRPSARADAAVLSPEQIVQRMRDEVLPAATGHGGFSDSVIDLASMETVPAEMMPSLGGVPADDPLRRIDALQPGERLRLFLQGRWRRVQLLWRSDKGMFLLFAGETAGRTHSVTRRALERLAAAGLLQPLEPRSLTQRAVDAVMRDVGRLPPG